MNIQKTYNERMEEILRQRLTRSPNSLLTKLVPKHIYNNSLQAKTMLHTGNNDTVIPGTIYKHSGR